MSMESEDSVTEEELDGRNWFLWRIFRKLRIVFRNYWTLDGGKYSAEYSRYNPIANSFDKPLDKMVYSLMPDVDVNYVCCYHRNRPSNDYQLVSETFVQGPASLIAAK